MLPQQSFTSGMVFFQRCTAFVTKFTLWNLPKSSGLTYSDNSLTRFWKIISKSRSFRKHMMILSNEVHTWCLLEIPVGYLVLTSQSFCRNVQPFNDTVFLHCLQVLLHLLRFMTDVNSRRLNVKNKFKGVSRKVWV